MKSRFVFFCILLVSKHLRMFCFLKLKHLFWRGMNLFWGVLCWISSVEYRFFVSTWCLSQLFICIWYVFLATISTNTYPRTKQANRRQHENMTCNKKGDKSFNCHSFFGWHPLLTVGSPVLMKPTSPKHFLSNFSSKLKRQNSQQLKHHGKNHSEHLGNMESSLVPNLPFEVRPFAVAMVH